MYQLNRTRLFRWLWPMLLWMAGVLAAALWLGYRVAGQVSMHPSDAPNWGGIWWAVWPALLMLLVLMAIALWAVRKTLMPWLSLAQSVQARVPSDLELIEVAAWAPHAVQSMAKSLNRWLARANDERGAQQRFIADAAHQLRTPLAALQAQVEAWALMAQAAPGKSIVLSVDQVKLLRNATRRTTQLANQLLALSRAENQLGQDEQKERVDLQSLCETLLTLFLDRAVAKDLDLGLEAQPAHVTGHEWLLRELISNLLDNAIKYTPRGGCITLRCGRYGRDERSECVVLEVEDDGPGVPVGEYARLTQRFYRACGAGSEGTGLGLAIVQEIAQGHGAALHFSPGMHQHGLKVQLIFAA